MCSLPFFPIFFSVSLLLRFKESSVEEQEQDKEDRENYNNRSQTGGLIPSGGSHVGKARSLFVIVMFYVNMLHSCTICVRYCTTKLSGHIQPCYYTNILHCGTNSIGAMCCMILLPFVPSHVSRCSGILACVQNRVSWELLICLFHSLHPARISHVGLQALNQTDMRTWHRLLRPIRTLAACRCSPVCAPGCDFLRVEAAQETSGGRMSVGVISTLLGPAELSGFFFLLALCERCFVCRGPQAAGGVEGRDAEKDYHYETAVMLLALWGNAGVSIRSLCCAPCGELDVLTVQRRSFVRAHNSTRCELINAGCDLIEESDLMAK